MAADPDISPYWPWDMEIQSCKENNSSVLSGDKEVMLIDEELMVSTEQMIVEK